MVDTAVISDRAATVDIVEQTRTSQILRLRSLMIMVGAHACRPIFAGSLGPGLAGAAPPLRPAELPKLLVYLAAVTDPRRCAGCRHSLVAILALAVAAFCYGIGGGGCQLGFHVQRGSYKTDSLINVRKQLRTFLAGQKATVLWDGLPSHRSNKLLAWIGSQRDWLVVERLPAYAPELNPAEGLWSNMKQVAFANLTFDSLGEVITQAHRGIDRVRGTPHPAYSFLRRAGLSVSSIT